MDEPDLGDVLRETREAFASLAADFSSAWQKVLDDAEYRFDKELGKQVAKHPELYAELKKTVKQVRRGVAKFSKDLGL